MAAHWLAVSGAAKGDLHGGDRFDDLRPSVYPLTTRIPNHSTQKDSTNILVHPNIVRLYNPHP